MQGDLIDSLIELLLLLGGQGDRQGHLEANDIVVVAQVPGRRREPKIVTTWKLNLSHKEALREFLMLKTDEEAQEMVLVDDAHVCALALDGSEVERAPIKTICAAIIVVTVCRLSIPKHDTCEDIVVLLSIAVGVKEDAEALEEIIGAEDRTISPDLLRVPERKPVAKELRTSHRGGKRRKSKTYTH
jgi:hypothetical protein